MNRRTALLAATLLLAACTASEESARDDAGVIEAVHAVIKAQEAAWNRGDIEGFMIGYERAETTTFISGDELTRGWDVVLARYKKRYSSKEQMGRLTFSDIRIQPVAAEYVLVDGRWGLALPNEMPHGRFTLLFRQTKDGWRIVHDTTTSANT